MPASGPRPNAPGSPRNVRRSAPGSTAACRRRWRASRPSSKRRSDASAASRASWRSRARPRRASPRACARSRANGHRERRTTAEAVDERAAGSGPGWSLPVFTDEFYDSIRRWDRKIIRIAFEKIVRLAEDWRHPSLRAIPLEGLPDCYRIRIATDVRLIYRPLDGDRVEIMSLIDREDLQRYIRQAKTKRGA